MSDAPPADAPPADPPSPPADPPAPPADPPTPDPAAGKKVEMSQAELDELVSKRVAKAVKTAQDEAKAKADRDKLDETERLKLEKADAEKAAADVLTKANARLVASDARVAAVTAGVKPERLDAFLRISDLAGIEVDDDGNVDTKAVKKAIDATLKDFPEFKGTDTGAGRAGGQHNNEPPAGRATSIEDAVKVRLAG